MVSIEVKNLGSTLENHGWVGRQGRKNGFKVILILILGHLNKLIKDGSWPRHGVTGQRSSSSRWHGRLSAWLRHDRISTVTHIKQHDMTWNQSRRWYKQDYHVKARGENGRRACAWGSN
jgi:hypothetical protein